MCSLSPTNYGTVRRKKNMINFERMPQEPVELSDSDPSACETSLQENLICEPQQSPYGY